MPSLSDLYRIISDLGNFLEAHNGAIAAVSTVFVAAFTYTLWRATTRLWRSSQQHSSHLESSINEASRSATAMEKVANAMAENAESVKTSVTMQREIADRQKLITELQSRAYLSIVLMGVVPQNSDTGYRYEPRLAIVNNGSTPAYDVSFRASSDLCHFPLAPDFAFPLPEAVPTRSISVIGPHQNKILTVPVPRIYSEQEVQALKLGITQRIFAWGVVAYRDAFGLDRRVRFCQSFVCLANDNVMGFDTNRHNDAN
jgi:hypothetical protein